MKKYDLFIYYIIILLFSLSEGKNKRIIIEGKEEGNCKVKRGTEKRAENGRRNHVFKKYNRFIKRFRIEKNPPKIRL